MSAKTRAVDMIDHPMADGISSGRIRRHVRCAGGGRCAGTIVKGTKAGRRIGRCCAMCNVSFFQMIKFFRQETREKTF